MNFHVIEIHLALCQRSAIEASRSPSMPYNTLFVHTIIHPTRASEHATAAITRDTRDVVAEAGTTAGKDSDENLDSAISMFNLSPCASIGVPSTKVYHFPCCLKQNSCRLLKYGADSRRARAAARGKKEQHSNWRILAFSKSGRH
jgi:hypothetical protein